MLSILERGKAFNTSMSTDFGTMYIGVMRS